MGLIGSGEHEELLKLTHTGDNDDLQEKYKAYLDSEQLNYMQTISSFDIWGYK